MSALAKHMVSRPTLSRFLLLSDMCSRRQNRAGNAASGAAAATLCGSVHTNGKRGGGRWAGSNTDAFSRF